MRSVPRPMASKHAGLACSPEVQSDSNFADLADRDRRASTGVHLRRAAKCVAPVRANVEGFETAGVDARQR